jgi:signal recognition particle subunit SRP54
MKDDMDFTVHDFLNQLEAIKKSGESYSDLIMMIPNVDRCGIDVDELNDMDKNVDVYIDIIQSMSTKEKSNPSSLCAGRIRDIARNVSCTELLFHQFIDEYLAMANVVKKVLGDNDGMGSLAKLRPGDPPRKGPNIFDSYNDID